MSQDNGWAIAIVGVIVMLCGLILMVAAWGIGHDERRLDTRLRLCAAASETPAAWQRCVKEAGR